MIAAIKPLVITLINIHLTANTSRPCLHAAASATSDGISSMHGGHHVAQKFATTCPLNWLNVTLRSESRTVKSGATDQSARRRPAITPRHGPQKESTANKQTAPVLADKPCATAAHAPALSEVEGSVRAKLRTLSSALAA